MNELVEHTFHSLAEEFLRRFRLEKCSVELFASEYPQFASTILDEFPGLVLAEQLKASISDHSPKSKMPKSIAGYRLQKEIGSGGMGYVYLAKHPNQSHDVAVKILPLDRLRSPSCLKRFSVEAQTCQQLVHPSIVPVYEHGTDGDFAYLVMRFVKGFCLDQLIEKLSQQDKISSSTLNTLDWNIIATLGHQIASALDYAHRHGVVHRDIKPSNLIIDQDGTICILDFGVAKVKEIDTRLSRTGDIIGTPRYMAPEQLRGACDARCDIYATGVTLYELASGSSVWRSLSFKQLLKERATLELPDIRELNPMIPDELASIIMKACELKPEQRYQTAGELSHALLSHLNSAASDASSPVVCRSNTGWTSGTSQPVALSGLVLLGILAVFGVAIYAAL